ncbi:D-alanyl-D-alanine carboxypeptidase family protein [Ornithinibacillus scapharcae]|uniref:D-alanyl-D-alanine carboxypeptidase family protein n=1 Tax=Ornithinibacillus scapharcae TaxID=1147159 RepID=UPI000225C00F|nr:D-alanyl-D-alanine carboxypeptidase family protein [Ornithinibacillus scapharcae]
MFNHKAFYILLIGCILLVLAACNQDKEAVAKDETENNTSEHVDDTGTTKNEPEEATLVLPDVVLQKGDNSEDVKNLQKVLTELGYEITISETFSQETVWALTDFQLQSGNLAITGIYDEETRQELDNYLEQELVVKPGDGLPFKEDEFLDEDTIIIGNPYEVLALINKQHALPEGFIPSDLVVPDVRFPFVEDLPKKQMRQVAADALEKMFTDADAESLDLFAQSGYRSYERQVSLFATYASNYGEEEANKFSARPGESEHQTGLTMDVTSPHVNYALVTEFGETEEGIWLEKHAAEYGFIIRYPKGKEDITGYQYEPWHLRYVGVKAATEIMERGITLEEYLEEKLTD